MTGRLLILAVIVSGLAVTSCGSEHAKPRRVVPAAPQWATAEADLGLAPAPQVVTATCALLSRQAHAQNVAMTVYCPPVVPAVFPVTRETAGGVLRYRQMRDGYQASFFSLRARWVYRWGGHWTFGASRDGGLSVYLRGNPPGSLRVHFEHAVLAGRHVTIFSLAQNQAAFYAGHVGVLWKQDGTTFDVTVHGKKWRSRVVAMARALIREIETCGVAARLPACSKLVFR